MRDSEEVKTLDGPRFIVVEGPIGVGKTTLARRLAESFGSDLLLEGAEENPFLERFYQDPRSVALQTQLFFLFQRAQQLKALRQSDMFQPVRVADYIMEKDRLFAELTLDKEEFKLYEQVYAHVTLDAGDRVHHHPLASRQENPAGSDGNPATHHLARYRSVVIHLIGNPAPEGARSI